MAAGAYGQRHRARARHGATLGGHSEPLLAAVFGFYEHHARAGVAMAADLVVCGRVSRGSYKLLLHHATKGRPIATRPVKLVRNRRGTTRAVIPWARVQGALANQVRSGA